jgi:hypothetical protein
MTSKPLDECGGSSWGYSRSNCCAAAQAVDACCDCSCAAFGLCYLQHDEFYNNLLAGKSGVTEISTFDASQFTTRFAGEIKVCTPAWQHTSPSSCAVNVHVAC